MCNGWQNVAGTQATQLTRFPSLYSSVFCSFKKNPMRCPRWRQAHSWSLLNTRSNRSPPSANGQLPRTLDAMRARARWGPSVMWARKRVEGSETQRPNGSVAARRRQRHVRAATGPRGSSPLSGLPADSPDQTAVARWEVGTNPSK